MCSNFRWENGINFYVSIDLPPKGMAVKVVLRSEIGWFGLMVRVGGV